MISITGQCLGFMRLYDVSLYGDVRNVCTFFMMGRMEVAGREKTQWKCSMKAARGARSANPNTTISGGF